MWLSSSEGKEGDVEGLLVVLAFGSHVAGYNCQIGASVQRSHVAGQVLTLTPQIWSRRSYACPPPLSPRKKHATTNVLRGVR